MIKSVLNKFASLRAYSPFHSRSFASSSVRAYSPFHSRSFASSSVRAYSPFHSRSFASRGVSIYIAIFCLLLFSSLAFMICSLVATSTETATNYLASEQALHIAEAGAQYSIYRIVNNQYQNWTSGESDEQSLGSGTYTFEVSDKLEEEKKVIISRGYVPNKSNFRAMREIKIETGYKFQGIYVACWRMDEEEGSWDDLPIEDRVIDSSYNKYHGTAQNGANTIWDSERGRVGNFNENNGYVELDDISEFELGPDDVMSLEAWIYVNGAQRADIVGRNNNSWSVRNWTWNFYMYSSRRLGFGIGDGSNFNYQGDFYRISLGEWKHIAIVMGKQGESIDFYVDGAYQAGKSITRTLGQLRQTSNPFRLGGEFHYFKGYIDEVKIYDRSLSAAEILEHSKEGKDPTEMRGLFGYWHMDEDSWNGTANEVEDVSERNHHGRARSGANTIATSKLGRCGNFDGNNDYVDLGDIDEFELGPDDVMSLEAWIYVNGAQRADIVGRNNNTWSVRNWTWNFYMYSNGRLAFGIGDGSSSNYQSNFYIISEGQWKHIAIVMGKQNEAIDFYVNGAYQAGKSITRTLGQLRQTSNPFRIGGEFHRFDGRIDEVRVYKNRTLSPEQIQAHYEETRDLIAYWHMDEDEGSWDDPPIDDRVIDSSYTVSHDNPGTAKPTGSGPNTITDRTKLGRCGSFDAGNDNYVEIGSDSSLDLIDEITLEAWIKPKNFSSAGYIWCRNLNDYAGIQYAAYLEHDNELIIKVMNTVWNTGYIFPVDSWRHVVVNIKSGGLMNYYINGEYKDQHSCPTIESKDCRFNIGARNDGTSGGHAYYFDGLIDEARVYKRFLLGDEILEHYEETKTVVFKGLVGHWHMDEEVGSWNGTPNEVIDTSYSKNHGTAGPAGSTPNAVLDEGKGIVGRFDGNNDYVGCGDDASLDLTDEITMEAWIKPDDFSSAGYIWVRNISSYGNIQYAGYLEQDNSLWIKVMNTAWNTGYTFPPVDVYWKHIVVTIKSADVMKYYINGKYRAQHSCPTITSQDCRFNIGARNDGATGHAYYFDGLIDEVRVYGRILSDEEIAEHYEEGIEAGGVATGSYTWREE